MVVDGEASVVTEVEVEVEVVLSADVLLPVADVEPSVDGVEGVDGAVSGSEPSGLSGVPLCAEQLSGMLLDLYQPLSVLGQAEVAR